MDWILFTCTVLGCQGPAGFIQDQGSDHGIELRQLVIKGIVGRGAGLNEKQDWCAGQGRRQLRGGFLRYLPGPSCAGLS